MTRPPRFLDQRLRMRQLRFLQALDQTRSLSKAARLLGLTQPALTKALHELEDALGEALFERHPLGVTPTAAGEVAIRFAARTLSELGRLDDELDRLGQPGGGLVVLGAFPVAAAGLLPPIVNQLRLTHPDLEVRLVDGRVEDLMPKLEAGEVHAVFGRLYTPELPDGFQREALYQEPISAIARAGHPLFARKGPISLADYDLILPTFSQRIGREIEHMLSALGLGASPRTLRSTSHMFIREMLHDSDMIAMAPRALMAGDLRRGTLKVVPVDAASPFRPAGLMLNPARPSPPSVGLLLEVIRRTVADLIAENQSGITSVHGVGAESNDRPRRRPA
ncbi:MAG: LysR substrate-binding domain-containing protein [Caulobacteraceae bacterium]